MKHSLQITHTSPIPYSPFYPATRKPQQRTAARLVFACATFWPESHPILTGRVFSTQEHLVPESGIYSDVTKFPFPNAETPLNQRRTFRPTFFKGETYASIN
jgi:hypothetical protein